MLPDRVFYPLFLLLAGALVALALVWPQGQGRPSPKPFGHPMAMSVTPIGKPLAQRLGIQ